MLSGNNLTEGNIGAIGNLGATMGNGIPGIPGGNGCGRVIPGGNWILPMGGSGYPGVDISPGWSIMNIFGRIINA